MPKLNQIARTSARTLRFSQVQQFDTLTDAPALILETIDTMWKLISAIISRARRFFVNACRLYSDSTGLDLGCEAITASHGKLWSLMMYVI